MRQQRRQFVGVAGDRVSGSDRHQRRRGDLRDFRARERLPRAADAGGERAQIAAVLVGEGAEHALHGIGERVERRRLHRVGDAERQADAVNEMIAEAAEDQRAHKLRPLQRQECAAIRAPIE